MNRRIAMVLVVVLVAVALAGVIGHGPWLYHGPLWLFPLLGLLLILALVRGLFWRGRCAGGAWKHGVPPAFEEWHRRAHQSQPPDESAR